MTIESPTDALSGTTLAITPATVALAVAVLVRDIPPLGECAMLSTLRSGDEPASTVNCSPLGT